MPKHPDFEKIYKRFINSYGEKKGNELYYAWLNKKGFDDTKPYPKGKEKKEKQCIVRGLEVKEEGQEFHIEGLIATTHIDELDIIPDMIPKETLESFANQINTNHDSRVMGVHHSEGLPINAEYFGEADIDNTPAKVIQLNDGEWGLYVDTKLLKDDPKTPEIIDKFKRGDLDSFSITYDTHGFETTDFEWIDDKLVRVLKPETELYGYTAASNPVNPNAVAIGFGFKEFKEIIKMEDKEKKKDKKWIQDAVSEKDKGKFKAYCKREGYSGVSQECINHAIKQGGHAAKMANFAINVSKGKYHHPSSEKKEFKDNMEGKIMAEEEEGKTEEITVTPEQEETKEVPQEQTEEVKVEEPSEEKVEVNDSEMKEFLEYKKNKKEIEIKEMIEKTTQKIVEGVLNKMEVKEKVIKNNTSNNDSEIPLEIKEFREVLEHKPIELKEQFKRAARYADKIGVSWDSTTSRVEEREFKSFSIGANGRDLEFKGLGITTNQNTDTDYLQSSAELQDIYDPIIYNALNQETVTWNLLAKDDYSSKGNNQVQFSLKTAANTSAAFYTGNSVSTGNVSRLKFQTKFKKVQVGVSVDGDMIAAARGGAVSDVFAQEVLDSTMDMLSVVNAALFAETGLETAAAPIGFEYITDSAGNTTLYNLTRSTTNRLAPDSAGDTYINQSGSIISMKNLRAAIRQARLQGVSKRSMVFITNPVQGDMLRSKFDDSRRLLTPRDTDFGFSTDLYVDGVPVFEDKDCNTDDWFLVDLNTHRIAIWRPPTIERLGKSADSEDAFIKMYFATYNRLPRAMVQIYGCATS